MQTTLEIDLNHPKIHRALTTDIRAMGLDGSFEENPQLEKRIARTNIHFNDEEDCYTDHEAIFMGLNFSYFTGDINEKFITARTVGGHEMGHIRFTSKYDWDAFCHKSLRVYGQLGYFSRDVFNIIEDRRMERLMGMVSTFLQKNFFLLGYRMVKDIEKEANEEIAANPKLTSMDKLLIIRNALLYISVMRMLPNIHDEEIMEYLKDCYPFVLYARVSKTTAGAAKATEKIMEVLEPLHGEFKKETNARIPAIFKFRSLGTSNPSGEGGFKSISGTGEAINLPPEIEKKIGDMISNVAKSMEESTQSDQKTENESNNINSEVRNYVDDITGNMEKNIESIARDIETEIKHMETEAKAPVTAEILHELLHSVKKEKQQKIKEQKENLKIQNLKPRIDEPLHKGVKAIFKEKEKMDTFSAIEYDNLKRPIAGIVNKTARELEDLAQMTIERTLRRRKRGKIDKRQLTKLAAFSEQRIFNKKKIEEEQLKMEVMLLIDVSGSNNAQMINRKNDTYIARYVMNQIVSILFHETLKKAKFDHTIWTFYEGGGGNCQFSSIVDRGNCHDRNAGMALKEVGAWGSNRDGFAIRYAGEYLNNYAQSEKRLLIVLSDGQPAASGYGGKSAMEDVKAAVADVEKGGAKVVGIFTGNEDENKYFSSMYENRIFVNNESIFELPKKLKNLLLEEFQEYLDQL